MMMRFVCLAAEGEEAERFCGMQVLGNERTDGIVG